MQHIFKIQKDISLSLTSTIKFFDEKKKKIIKNKAIL